MHEGRLSVVMPAHAGIHVFLIGRQRKTWMAGTSPAMTGMAIRIHYGGAQRGTSMNAASEPTGKIITAAILVIGDEILSGRTKDKNIGYIAEYLTNIGIDLREVRVVPDVEEEIVTALNALR